MKPAVLAVVAVAGLGGITSCLPILGAGISGPSDNAMCAVAGELDPLGDGSPSILGAATLTHEDLSSWWGSTGRGQPTQLAVPITDLIALYLSEGAIEGVRSDLAFAQAVHETSYFTSQDTSVNNFAGIARYDGAASGRTFEDVPGGVRAHIQLLKKFAQGNDTNLASPDIAPDAGASARTWAELTGTWATDPNYWSALDRLYQQMAQQEIEGLAGEPSPSPITCEDGAESSGTTDGDILVTEVRGITVNADMADQVEDLLAAAELDGLTLTGWGYRSTSEQIELRRSHCGTSEHAIYRMPASQCSPPTARPGTSMHEQGLAIDFENCSSRTTACYQWLSANAASYGLFNLPSEAWHWSIDGS